MAAPIAITPSGTRTFIYDDLTATFEPITLTLPSGTFNTGVIQLMLDISDPAANFAVLNYDTGILESHTNLLLTSPFLQVLGIPAQMLHVDEAGPFIFSPSTLPVGVQTTVTFTALLTGGGTFGPGQLLSGWIYSNGRGVEVSEEEEAEVDVLGHEIIKEKAKAKIKIQTVSDPEPATLKSPPSNTSIPKQQIPMNGEGTGTAQEKLPEPSTVLLVSAGMLGGVILRLRKLAKTRMNRAPSRGLRRVNADHLSANSKSCFNDVGLWLLPFDARSYYLCGTGSRF